MTRKLDAEIAVPAQCELAEGPVWDAARGLLRWVDILPGHVHALDPVSGARSSFGVGQPVGTVGLTRDGGLVLALAGGFALSGPEGQELRPFGDFSVDRSVTRFNDGKPDPWGSFWAGTMAVPEDSGYPCRLYRLGPDGVVTELLGDVGLSNGLDWSDDRRVFYYSDSAPTARRDLRRRARRPDPGRRGLPLARRLGQRRTAPLHPGRPPRYRREAAGQPGHLGRVRRRGPEHPVHHDSQGELHSRRPGRPAARGRHLRLRPRRHRAPAILVRWLS